MVIFRELAKAGVLGNNRRIRDFILPYNNKSDYPLVDDKFLTSQLLLSKGIPHPKTRGLIQVISDTKHLHSQLKNIDEFVVKPAKGAMGNGIVIVEKVDWDESKKKTKIVTTRQASMSYDEFVYYISMILSGVFSLSGQMDRALFQEKLVIHPFFKDISYRGIPDVRVILFRGFPVMAMVRLPTESSGGRGNLHQGAVGCGINLLDGSIIGAMQDNKRISRHPDCGEQELIGLKIPMWKEVLAVAAQCSGLARIQYLGVDIVIDPIRGPLVLEMNARPGLSIQIANGKGLLPRLQKVALVDTKNMSEEDKIQFSLENFGSY